MLAIKLATYKANSDICIRQDYFYSSNNSFTIYIALSFMWMEPEF